MGKCSKKSVTTKGEAASAVIKVTKTLKKVKRAKVNPKKMKNPPASDSYINSSSKEKPAPTTKSDSVKGKAESSWCVDESSSSDEEPIAAKSAKPAAEDSSSSEDESEDGSEDESEEDSEYRRRFGPRGGLYVGGRYGGGSCGGRRLCVKLC